jgi:glycosyltransferase involved in cell wall biosynthesis
MMADEKLIPLVSIITPSYNQAEFLEDTILSVKNQYYPALEHFVIDGGSTDGSVDIIKKYSSHLAWWVSEPDEGQAAAINKGMSRANGEYVAWLNSDDFYLPGAVDQAMAAFRENPEVGMVFGNALTVDAQGQPIRALVFSDWQLEDLMAFRIICQPAVFMRRTFYEQVKGLDERYHFMLDHHLWIRLASITPIKHVPSFWAASRHHVAAKNVSQATSFGREALEILDWMEQQPELAPIVESNRHQVQGGAYQFNARYLMDGGQYGPALKSYGRAFLNRPGYAVEHWHRILYAIFGLLGARNLDKVYARYQDSHRPDLSGNSNLQNWHGLHVNEIE